MSLRESVLAFADEAWGVAPDYPWAGDSESAVLRHPGNGKWFALALRVRAHSLGLKRDAEVDIVNLKCDPLMLPSLLRKPGYLSAYHMNKSNWLTILLDGTVPMEEIAYLMQVSHDLTRPVIRGKRRERHEP